MNPRCRKIPICWSAAVLWFFLSNSAAAAELAAIPGPITAERAIGLDLAAGKITRQEALEYRTYSAFRRDLLPEQYRTIAPERRNLCNTLQLRRTLEQWNELPEAARNAVPRFFRPDAGKMDIRVPKGTLPKGTALVPLKGTDPGIPVDWPYDREYATDNFLVRYSTSGVDRVQDSTDANSNGVPDIIERTGEYFEASRTWAIANGLRLPVGTDNYYYNVYINYVFDWYYGATYFVDYPPARYSRSYIVLSNDLPSLQLETGRWVGLTDMTRVIIAHEFMHAIQFAYDAGEDPWWMETTAMWAMEQVGPEWDAVDLYTLWIYDFFQYPEVSLDNNDDWQGWHWYASMVWATYLHEKLDPGDGSIIREIWENCDYKPTDKNAIAACRAVIPNYDAGGFNKVFRDFLVANYEMDYNEAADYPETFGALYYTAWHYTYPTGVRTPASYRPEGLGSNYVHCMPNTAPDTDLNCIYNGVTVSPNWTGILVGKLSSGGFSRLDLTAGTAGTIYGFNLDCDDAALIVSPVRSDTVYGSTWQYNYSAYLSTSDILPPSPSPMTWSTPPHATGTTSVAMTASVAVDAASNPVTYFFEEITGSSGASSSDWQSSTNFTDTGLSYNTRYGYRARARDSAPRKNVTGYSAIVYVYTLCNTPGAPTLYDPSPTKLYVSVNAADGNPSSTQYTVYCQTVDKYVAADGSLAAGPYYATRSAWDSIRIKGLSPDTDYSFSVKARNGDAIATGAGPTSTLRTLPADTAAPLIQGAAHVPTWVKEDITTTASVVATGNDRSTGGSDIVAAEYFIDSDPGQGDGTSITPVDGTFDSPTEAFAIALDTRNWLIADSPYNVYVRVRDEAGFWSTPSLSSILVVDGVPPMTVTDLEAQPTAPGLSEMADLALNSASSEDPGNPATNAVDSNDVTFWATEPGDEASPQDITFDLLDPSVCTAITLIPSDRVDLFPARFRVKVSDGESWHTVVSEYDYVASSGANVWQFAPQRASQIRIVVEETLLDTGTDKYTAHVAEVQVKRDIGGQRAVAVSWTSPSDVGPAGRATSYFLKLNTDASALQSFQGNEPLEPVPAPASAGTPQDMTVTYLDAGTTYHFALKSVDEYENYSAVSNIASVTTLPETSAYIVLDSPVDQGNLDVSSAPTFQWHANICNTFKLQFSNDPSFPSRPYKDYLGRTVKSVVVSVRKGQSDLTLSKSQWKGVKSMAAGMDGTLYWRVQGTSSVNKAIGVVHSEVFHEYGFAAGLYADIFVGPAHSRDGVLAIWPDFRPQFLWSVSAPTYATYYVDFSTSPDINIYDRKNTLTLRSKNADRTWFKPSLAEWKNIKKRIAVPNNGLVYWRIRGVDVDKAYSFAGDPVALLIDSPHFELRKPSPRRDGTVKPGDVFTLDWAIDGEGYPYFEIQISTSDAFPRGAQTFSLKKLTTMSYTLTSSNVKKIESLCAKAVTDTFYWRVVTTDLDRIMSAPSEPQAVTISEQPAGGGA